MSVLFDFNDLDLSGFSRSKNWAGYFERKDRFSHEFVEEAISIFNGFFGAKREDFFVVSALRYYPYRMEKKSYRYYEEYSELIRKNIIKRTDGPFIDCISGWDCMLPYHYLTFSDHSTMDSLSRMLMSSGTLRGEVCFFINTALNIAVYPHADTGFGCMGLNSTIASCVDFLEYCRQFENFTVVIKRRRPRKKIYRKRTSL